MRKASEECRAQLVELWTAQTQLMHAYTAAVARYNVAVADACAALCVPQGYAIDVLGDGSIVPVGELTKVPK